MMLRRWGALYVLSVATLVLGVVAVSQHVWISGNNERLDAADAQIETLQQSGAVARRAAETALDELHQLRQEIAGATAAKALAERTLQSAATRMEEAKRVEAEAIDRLNALESRLRTETEARVVAERTIAEAQSELAEAKRLAGEARLDADASAKELLALREELERLRHVTSAVGAPAAVLGSASASGPSTVPMPQVTTGAVTPAAEDATRNAAPPANLTETLAAPQAAVPPATAPTGAPNAPPAAAAATPPVTTAPKPAAASEPKPDKNKPRAASRTTPARKKKPASDTGGGPIFSF